MSRRATGYCLLAAILLVCSTTVWMVRQSIDNRGRLTLLRRVIAEQGWAASSAELRALEGRLGVGEKARIGLVLLAALTEEPNREEGDPLDLEQVSFYPVERLLQRALEERRFDGCLRTIELLRRGGSPDFADLEAAALLELGRIESARAVELGSSADTEIGRRLRQLFEAEHALDHVPLRDRNGRLLGTVSAFGRGEFKSTAGVDEILIPRRALEGVGTLQPTGGVRLTIDLEISRAALAALGRHYRGSIVVLDSATGDVLAAVSDRKTWEEGGTPTYEQLREPASIAKLITVTAAMRAGIDVDQVIGAMRCRGAVNYDDGPLYCTAVNGRLRGLERALAVSCNVAFAELGRLVGAENLIEEYRRYGYDLDRSKATHFGRVLVTNPSARQLGELAIGLEASEVTPVHTALQAATYSNGGFMFEPRLLRSTKTFLGLSESLLPPATKWRVLEESWLPQIVNAMKAVVAPGGTAARIAPESFPVALKTGTASDPRYGFHVNYVGFGPLPDARYAFSVRLTHQRTSQRVRRAAYAVTRRLLQSLAGGQTPRAVLAAGE